MNTNFLSKEAPDIIAEASAWIAQIETGKLSAADLDAFREWIHRSPRHASEIKRLATLSKDLNVLTEMAEPLSDAVNQYNQIIKHSARRTVFSSPRIAMFAVFACVIFAVLFFVRTQSNSISDGHLIIATTIGDYRDIELSDGTLVKLNTNSRIEIDYDNRTRNVRLLAGEAYFDVISNSTRPFLVYAGNNYVRVIGTAFVVRLSERDLEVTVTRGKVQVADAITLTGYAEDEKGSEKQIVNRVQGSIPTTVPISLQARQSITISAENEKGSIVTLSERDLTRELSWKEGLHDFSNTPLEEVVKEISRHSSLDIEIADQSLRDLKFGGIFRTGETQPLFDALEAAFGVNVEYLNGNKIRLSLAEQE